MTDSTTGTTDSTGHRLVIRLAAIAAVALALGATLVLATVIGLAAAAIGAFLIVGSAVHLAVGRTMQRQPDHWGGLGDVVIVTALAYPLVLWIGGALYVALTRSLALGAVVAIAPLVLVVLATVLGGPEGGPRRTAQRSRRAFAAERQP